MHGPVLGDRSTRQRIWGGGGVPQWAAGDRLPEERNCAEACGRRESQPREEVGGGHSGSVVPRRGCAPASPKAASTAHPSVCFGGSGTDPKHACLTSPLMWTRWPGDLTLRATVLDPEVGTHLVCSRKGKDERRSEREPGSRDEPTVGTQVCQGTGRLPGGQPPFLPLHRPPHLPPRNAGLALRGDRGRGETGQSLRAACRSGEVAP